MAIPTKNFKVEHMKCTRRNVTQPGDWWLAFASAAKQKDMTLSEWMGWACKRQVDKEVRNTLSDRPAANRPMSVN